MVIRFTVNTKVESVKKTSVETAFYNWLRGSKEVSEKNNKGPIILDMLVPFQCIMHIGNLRAIINNLWQGPRSIITINV